MATAVQMKHPVTGIRKQGYFGFSWTYMFFGFFVPLLRGHYPMAGIHFVISLISFLTIWLPTIILAFFFNKFYTIRLLEDGYIFDDDPALVKTACTVLNVLPPNHDA